MNRVFPILGTEIANLQGRDKELSRCYADLTKPSPSHLQLIGPRFSGKTTFLHKLKNSEKLISKYNCLVYWDVGHNTPQTDVEFLVQFSEKIAEALKPLNSDLASYLIGAGGIYQDIKEIIETFEEEEIRVLMLWDGMDKPLASGTLTRNLWDQLREIASHSGLRLVTASRKSMQELVRNEESQTSDFWNIFDQIPVRFSAFSEEDINDICESNGIKLGTGAVKEISNLTGFYPPLVLELLNCALDNDCKELTNTTVNTFAEQTNNGLEAILNKLWDDCSQEAKEAYHRLVDAGSFSSNQISTPIYNELNSLGLVQKNGNKVHPSCRLIENISKNDKEEQNALERVFSDEKSFEENISKVLQLRLNQLPKKHTLIHKVIQTCLSDIPEDLGTCLSHIRNITSKYFDLIWDLEFGGRTIPVGLIDIWSHEGRTDHNGFKNGKVPGNGDQAKSLKLLQLLVGAVTAGVKHSDIVDQQVYLYMNVLYNYGNYGQHNDGDVKIGSALTAVTASIELLEFFSNRPD